MFIGTHDSACYKINWDISFWEKTNRWEILRRLCKWCYPFRKFVEKYTCTQTKTITEQLRLNIDALDLRVAWANNVYYTAHTFCCSPYEEVMKEIYMHSVKRKNPLMIFISPDYNNIEGMKGREKELLLLTKKWLKPFVQNKQIKLYYKPINFDITRINKFDDSDENKKEFIIHHFDEIYNIWYNVDNIEDFRENIDHTLFTGNTCLHAVLTPRKPTSFHRTIQFICKDSLYHYARQVNVLTLRTLRLRLNRPKICMFDFIDENLIRTFRRIEYFK